MGADRVEPCPPQGTTALERLSRQALVRRPTTQRLVVDMDSKRPLDPATCGLWRCRTEIAMTPHAETTVSCGARHQDQAHAAQTGGFRCDVPVDHQGRNGDLESDIGCS